MSEDVRSDGVGDSYINHVKTEPRTLPLLYEMAQSSSLTLLRPGPPVRGEPTFEVDSGVAQEFFHSLKPIVEAIAFLVHSTGSGPLRLSEVVDDRYRNGSGPRNLYIAHGEVFFLRRNLKSSTLRGYRSSVIHFPPEKVAELLTYYLSVVRPVEILLAASLGWTDMHANYSQFLYVVKGQKLDPRGLSTIVSKFTDLYFKCQLTGSQLRHVLINIQHVFLPPIVDPSVQKFGDSQAGHSSSVANRVYGQRIDHLPGQEAALYNLAHDWCKRFHTVLGLGPETSRVRPIPYNLLSPERLPCQGTSVLPPQPLSTQEIMRQVHHAISSGLSFSVQEFSTRYEKMIRDCVFEAVAALSAKGIPNWPVASESLSDSDQASAGLSGPNVSFSMKFLDLSDVLFIVNRWI
jgi:hypothetical protein